MPFAGELGDAVLAELYRADPQRLPFLLYRHTSSQKPDPQPSPTFAGPGA
jgi:hypothetical protein